MNFLSLLIFSISIFSLNIFSRYDTSVFSGERANYVSELIEFMGSPAEKDQLVLDAFIQAWQQDSIFNEKEQEDIILLSQLMVSHKARPTPHFVEFIQCYLLFKDKPISADNYSSWLDGMQFLLEKKKVKSTELLNILRFTNGLLRDNTIYSSSSTLWKATSDDYKIRSENGIIVDFALTELRCLAKRDSMQIFETSGSVYPLELVWQGQKALVTWERAGFDRTEVFAELGEYKINLTKSEFTAKDVTFTNKNYFDEPLEGELLNKVMIIKDPDRATYPRFTSYTKEFEIKDLYKDIDYRGGLSMQGVKLVGTGTREKTARLDVYRNDTLVLVANSVFFGFKPDRISSQQTSVVLRLNQDSIYHPDLIFNFRVKNRELSLMKSENFTSQGPYFNSYHNVDMNFDYLLWRMDDDYIKLMAGRTAAVGNAYFESVNYFNYNKFINMQGMDRVHPLISLRSFSRKYESEEFPIEAYADYLKMPIATVKQMVMRMAYLGFVFYDQNTEEVVIKPRLHDYLSASVNKIDYDVIGFSSSVEAPLENALFDLKTYDLTINGIDYIHVSDSQNVSIYPRNKKIILKRNRNFQFDGTVDAGLLSFHGNNFFFNYDSFKINLQSVDSLELRYISDKYDNYGLPIIETVTSILNNITGEILIDNPENKSGKESYPEYPIFKSRENSYVYYEKNNIENGVYEANDFFFEVYPFEMDSLDNFNVEDMVFEGQFVSAGILPPFEKKLSLQPDNSLGFRHSTPKEGYPLYGGKGDYFDEIWLSNKGLRGGGSVKYLTSTTRSDDFRFYPDSMNALAQKYIIEQKLTETQYPFVSSANTDIHWLPYADVMYAEQTDVDFTMFNDSTTLKGGLQLRPEGLTGYGRMDLKSSEITSNLYTYKSQEIFADTSDFYLNSLHTDEHTVLTENVNTHISFNQRSGWFKSNEGYSLVDFPENKYVSYLDKFEWDMDEKRLAMGVSVAQTHYDEKDEDIEPEGPRYISVQHNQDSLNFVAPKAYYDYKNNILEAHGVKFIEVADARIYPDSGLVRVFEEADMEKLVNSRIRANKDSKYHTIHTATVKITSRKDYTGMGNYDYIDETGEIQTIHFSEVYVDSTLNTSAVGEIYESAAFRLSPAFKFQGKAILSAKQRLLTFMGGAKVEHNCDQLKPGWLYFTAEIDPLEVYIPVPEQPVNIDRNKIYAGLFTYYDSVHVYSAFFTSRKSYSDRPYNIPSGYLYYDKPQMRYKIGSMDKINNFELAEDYLSFHREDCKLFQEGELDLGEDLGQVKIRAFGNAQHDLNKNETKLDVVLTIDFYIDENMINIMGAEIDSIPNLEAVRLNRPVNLKAMHRLVGKEAYSKLQDELNLFGTIKELPEELKHTILLNDVQLVWDDYSNSYQSVGKIGIASINNIQINKKVNGMLELRIKRSGDIFDLYLEIDRRTYYYFGYTRGVMQTLASNRTYVETIMNMKPKERKHSAAKGQESYIYMISTDRKKNNFYRRYRDIRDGNQPSDKDDE